MIRKIIHIDDEKCNGCGLCAKACHEGAIAMIDGKAKLLRDDYCDGLGDCLPVCPVDAISFEQREALAFDAAKVIEHQNKKKSETQVKEAVKSALKQWPVQIKLAPMKGSFFGNAHLLISADCAAYAYGSFHEDFMKDKITLIGCPKLDEGDYTEKLTAILNNNSISSITAVRMEVPCCGGIEHAVKKAVASSKKNIPLKVVTISTEGEMIGTV